VIVRLAKSPQARMVLVLAALGGVAALLWWRGPDWGAVGDAFSAVSWIWVVVAIGINLASIVSRSVAWQIVINEAMPEPRPSYGLTFSAFCVGLLANAVLPGRIGELARVAVINRRLPEPRGATLLGTVFAHRVFDLVPVGGLILYVLVTAKIPAWAYSSLVGIVAVGMALFVFAVATARHYGSPRRLDGLGAVRRVILMMRQGLGVMHRPVPMMGAIFFQTVGWFLQLLAVYTAMRAFHIHAHFPVAALVLLVMNVVNVIPLWPGNVGAVQAAIALPLTSYGVAYADGIAFGFGLQAIEASVGIGIGLIFLAREGLSFATLRGMPGATEVDEMPDQQVEAGEPEAEPEREKVGAEP
jgi:uncharacterized protein (TIRG00374 family)